jgi:hypothetical protein
MLLYRLVPKPIRVARRFVHTEIFSCFEMIRSRFRTLNVLSLQACHELVSFCIYHWSISWYGTARLFWQNHTGFEFFILCSMHLFLLLVFCYIEGLINLAYFIFVLQNIECCQSRYIHNHLPVLLPNEVPASQWHLTSSFIFKCKRLHLISIIRAHHFNWNNMQYSHWKVSDTHSQY